jgi:hypothetical protein
MRLSPDQLQIFPPTESALLLSVRPPNPLKIPSILLGGPPPIVTRNRPRDLHLELHRLPGLSTFLALFVKLGRDGSGASVLREPANRYDMLVRTEPDSKGIADLELLGALCPLAIHLHLPRFYSRGGKCSRFEEARRP